MDLLLQLYRKMYQITQIISFFLKLLEICSRCAIPKDFWRDILEKSGCRVPRELGRYTKSGEFILPDEDLTTDIVVKVSHLFYYYFYFGVQLF